MSSSGKGSSRGGPLKNDGKSSHSGVPVQGGSRNPPPGGNPTNPSTSTANFSSIPPLLSLIIKIEPLSPNYGNDGQPPRHTREGYFLPPNRTNGYEAGNGPAILLRWMGGRLVPIAQDDEIRRIALHVYRYRTATVFTQNEDTPHLLAVPFDARERNVRDEISGWRPLTFNHERIPGTDRYYSYISCVGAETGIAAPGSAHWMPQLLPGWYQYRPRTSATRVQAGLIGNLPLLFALAAFSTPPTPAGLNVLGRSLQPGAWNPHANPYPSGHIPERGMVVTVYLDPRNPQHSVRESLERLQRGDYGPFYGPQRPPSTEPSTTAPTGYPTGPGTGSSKGHYTAGYQPRRGI